MLVRGMSEIDAEIAFMSGDYAGALSAETNLDYADGVVYAIRWLTERSAERPSDILEANEAEGEG